MERGGDKGGEILLVRFKCRQRVDAAVLAIVRRDLLVKVESCQWSYPFVGRTTFYIFKRAILFGEDCDASVITGTLSIQACLKTP